MSEAPKKNEENYFLNLEVNNTEKIKPGIVRKISKSGKIIPFAHPKFCVLNCYVKDFGKNYGDFHLMMWPFHNAFGAGVQFSLLYEGMKEKKHRCLISLNDENYKLIFEEKLIINILNNKNEIFSYELTSLNNLQRDFQMISLVSNQVFLMP